MWLSTLVGNTSTYAALAKQSQQRWGQRRLGDLAFSPIVAWRLFCSLGLTESEFSKFALRPLSTIFLASVAGGVILSRLSLTTWTLGVWSRSNFTAAAAKVLSFSPPGS